VDLLGRGESDAAPAARYDLDAEVGRLRFVLEALGVHRPFLAGHSHGAAIAVAASRTAQARGLLLVNPVTPDLERPAVLGTLRFPAVRIIVAPLLRLFRRPLTRYILVRRVFEDPASMLPGTIDRYSEPWKSSRRAIGLTRILSDWNPAELEEWDAAPEIPVYVVAGSRDRRIRVSSAREWAERLGGAFRLEAGCGHAAPEERPEAVASVLDEMLTVAGSQNGAETS
jgi:pimeloyl-ACP methyl ester carboxylesterase